MPTGFRHRVFFENLNAHIVEIETTLLADEPLPSPLTFSMAAWTPGSYMIREYARHVENFEGKSPDVRVEKVKKDAWRVTHDGLREVTVRYALYCNDLTVRTNHVDGSHAYFNGAPTFVTAEGFGQAPALVEVDRPKGWDVATSLAVVSRSEDTVTLRAPDYDTLVDSPVDVAKHRSATFEVSGVAHRFAVWPHGACTDENLKSLSADTGRIVETCATLFGGLPPEPYTFILHMYPRGRGGLEHTASSTLLAPPRSFETRASYIDLLSLVAHEYFHRWNVKKIRPEGLTPYRYDTENYTRLLWWFEGATSYYDHRVLRLARLESVEEYLDHLAAEFHYVETTPGALVRSLEQASFDAWVKLYRPDENSPNSSVSYYRKGEVVCALLDIELRVRSGGEATLDTLLAHLWGRFGSVGRPVPEAGMGVILSEVAGTSMSDLLDAWVAKPAALEPSATLAAVGLVLTAAAPKEGQVKVSLGARLRKDDGRVTIASVTRDGPATRAGLSSGDEILSVGTDRVTPGTLDATLSRFAPSESAAVVVNRDGHVLSVKVRFDEGPQDAKHLTADAGASPDARARFREWLGEDHPAWGGKGAR